MSKYRLEALAGLAILLFLAVGFSHIRQYGYGDDEQWLMRRARLASDISTAVFSDKALPAIPQWDWVFYPSFYGTVNYKWIGPAIVRLGLASPAAYHVFNLFMAALCLAALFLLGRRVVGAEAAFFGVFLFIFFPRFIAHAHYNPKEIPMMACVGLSMLAAASWIESGRLRTACLSGALLGMAGSIHVNAFSVLPVFPLLVLIERRARWVHGVVFAVCAASVFYLLWPLLWIEPGTFFEIVGHFKAVYKDDAVCYLGQIYARNNVPWHYVLFYAAAVTPLLTLIFMLRGIYKFPRGIYHVLLLTWAALPILIRLNPWAIKYNDIRHIFLSFPPLMIYAGWGLKSLLPNRPWVLPATIVGLSAYFLFQIVPIRPFEGDYFNEAFRLAFPAQIEKSFNFPSWVTPYHQGIDWLNKNAPQGATVCVSHRFSVTQVYKKRPDLRFVPEGAADYFMVAGLGWEPRPEYDSKTPVFEIRRYNSRLLAIYEN